MEQQRKESVDFEELRPVIEKIMQTRFFRVGKMGNAFQLMSKQKTEEALRKFLNIETLMKKYGVDHNWLSANEHGVGCTFKSGGGNLIVNFIDDQMILSLVY